MNKIRVFVRDESSRQAVSRLQFTGEVTMLDVREKGTPKIETVRLSLLATNMEGYLSFKLDCCWQLWTIQKVSIFIPGIREKIWVFEAKDMNLSNHSPLEILIEQDLYEDRPKDFSTPAVEDPDRWDFRYSNLSRRQSQLLLGSGDCEKMIPQHVQKDCYEIYHVIPESIREKVNTIQGPNGTIEVKTASLLLSEVCWDWLGYSLGKLVNTLSLAPCETFTYSVKNWRIDQERYSEESRTDEFKESMVQESMSSSMKGIDVGLKISPPVQTESEQKSSAKIWEQIVGYVLQAAKSPQNLADLSFKSQKKLLNQIRRTTSRLSSMHKVAMQRESVEGSSVRSTRTLTNLNQCHSQTTNLYEVVDNYEVSSCVKERRKGLLIKYSNDEFTKRRIFCNRHLFRGNLLDHALEPCLESIGKVSSCCEPEENGKDDCVKVNKLIASITIGTDTTGSQIALYLMIKGGQKFFDFQRNGRKYDKGATYTETINLGDDICVEDITEIGIRNKADGYPDGEFNLSKVSIQYFSPSFSGPKHFFSANPRIKFNKNEIDTLGKPTPFLPSKEEGMKNHCDDQEICCSEQLLDHFNCNKLYYNQIIWRYENPQERLVRFENYFYNGSPLSEEIINQPIAVYGQWVAFELADSYPQLPFQCVKDHIIVSLPTGGLFSETLLGRCNSCETPDLDVLEARTNHPCNCGCGDVEE